MTATPHNGKEEDFQLFMGLLDADRFEGRFPGGRPKGRPIGHDAAAHQGRTLPVRQQASVSGAPRLYSLLRVVAERESELYEAVTRYVREEMNRADRLG